MDMWNYFAQQFGMQNLLPIALAGDDNGDKPLPEGVRGKVPSVINSYGQRVGFKDWQNGRAKPSDIARWSEDPRYGFGVRLGFPLIGGGVAVCIDVDTENAEHQETVYLALKSLLGTPPPMRVRDNSNRRAYVICVETADAINKRIFTLRKGDKAAGTKPEAVEILATGQQFVAFGRHPSGAEIEWLNAPADNLAADVQLPDMQLQRVSLEQFNAFCDSLLRLLPVIVDTSKAARKRKGKGGDVAVTDAVADYLDAHGYTLFTGAEGQRFIKSPFAHEYTNEQGDGDTSVCYFPAGTRDYEQGHFVSLHASDASKSDADFIDAIGFVAAQFESYPATADSAGDSRPRFTQITGGKYHDRIEVTLPNVLAALASPGWLGHHIAYDDFTGAIVCGGPGKWRPFRDTDYTAIRLAMELKGFMPVGRELVRDAVHMTAETHSIDTAAEWLNAQTWDGTMRIAELLPRYFGAEDTAYTRAVSLYLMTALAGRILKPGIQADMMPILIGNQGCGKSRGVQALAPNLEWFTDAVTFRDSEANQARKLLGVCLAEFAEMSGLRKRDVEDIKAMVTRTTEKWEPKYIEYCKRYDRRAIFVGTSNDSELLDDSTGARRWLPVAVGLVQVRQLKADMPQLWAEAAACFKADGIQYQAAMETVIAEDMHEQHRVTDVAEETLYEWLHTADELDGSTPAQRNWVTSAQVIEALKARGSRIDDSRAGQMRAGKLLKALGFMPVQKVINKRRQRGYENPNFG